MKDIDLDFLEPFFQLHPAVLLYLALGVLTLAVAGGAHLWHHRMTGETRNRWPR
jgi:hypothetical protein